MYCVVLCQKAKKEIPCFLQSLIQYVTLVGGEGLKEQRKFDDGWCFFVYPFFFFNIIFYDYEIGHRSIDNSHFDSDFQNLFFLTLTHCPLSCIGRKRENVITNLFIGDLLSSLHYSHVRNNIQAVKYSISRLFLCNSPLKYSCQIFIICGFWSNFVLLFFKINYFWKSEKKSKDMYQHKIKV